MAQAEGVKNVHHWLKLIGASQWHEYQSRRWFGHRAIADNGAETTLTRTGEDRDGEWADLDTVAGYRRTVLCESVREELRHNMGGAVSCDVGPEVLLSICKGRLQATTWLEKV